MGEDIQINKLMVYYHMSWLNKIKNSIGKDCTHIIHVRDNKDYFLKAHIKNENGGVDKVMYKLGTHPNNLKEKDYNVLMTKLTERDYEKRSKRVLSDA